MQLAPAGMGIHSNAIQVTALNIIIAINDIAGLESENTTVGIRHADHVAPIRKTLALTSPTSGGRSVGIVRSRTQQRSLVY
jgi:hypothetical protein